MRTKVVVEIIHILYEVGHSNKVLFIQPKKIEEIKDFLITARRKDAKCEPLCLVFQMATHTYITP